MDSHLPAEQTGRLTLSLMGQGLEQGAQPLSLLTDQMHSQRILLMRRLHQQAGLWTPSSMGGILMVTGIVFDSSGPP